jgi:hypothetical protein
MPQTGSLSDACIILSFLILFNVFEKVLLLKAREP